MKLSTENLRINSIKDAQQAIIIVRKRIKLREQDLEMRLHQLPKESFKSATEAVLPAFISTRINGRSWSLIKDLFGLISPFGNNKPQILLGIAKQVGIVGILKTAIGFIKKKVS